MRVLTCFECGETDYLVKDCPQKKRTNFKKNDRKKKAMVASWSDSESSNESEDEKEQANLCLMADHEEDSNLYVDNMVSTIMS